MSVLNNPPKKPQSYVRVYSSYENVPIRKNLCVQNHDQKSSCLCKMPFLLRVLYSIWKFSMYCQFSQVANEKMSFLRATKYCSLKVYDIYEKRFSIKKRLGFEFAKNFTVMSREKKIPRGFRFYEPIFIPRLWKFQVQGRNYVLSIFFIFQKSVPFKEI